MYRQLLSVCAVAGLCGCAGLEFREASGPVPQGVRVRSAVACVVVREYTRKSGAKQVVEAIETLPLGEVYDVNVRQGLFSATEFSVSLTEQGALKQVTLNADPQVDETIKAAADLADSVSALKAPPRAGDDDPVVREAVIDVRPLKLSK
jgi:hypothetical protein